MKTYRAAVIGCSRMGGFIDNEGPDSLISRRPKSHGASYYACDRTDLIACSDQRSDVMEQFGKRYDVPKQRQYTDYRELIEKERPEIVSVATQPEHRAEIVVYAVEHGARAIYAEKAMAASMDEADAMVEAVERNGVFFNLGTNRRWVPGYDVMKEIIDGGELGALNTLITYQLGSLFNGGSHVLDLVLRLNSDRPVAWVQGHLPNADSDIQGDRLVEDPAGYGMLQFEDGVTAHLLDGRGARVRDYEAICERGSVASRNNGGQWELRREGPEAGRGRGPIVMGEFPEFQPASSGLRIVEDLVYALDTGEPTRGGVRVARASMELIFALIESQVRGGARVELPLTGSKFQLKRDRAPRQPTYEPRYPT